MILRLTEIFRREREITQETFKILIPGRCTLEITGKEGKGYTIKPLYSNNDDTVCIYTQFDPNNPVKGVLFDFLTHRSCSVKNLATEYTVVERYLKRYGDPQVSFRVIGTIDVASGMFTPASPPKEANQPE